MARSARKEEFLLGRWGEKWLNDDANITTDLTDGAELCGVSCVWLTKDASEKLWFGGRFVSATWDAEELTARRGEIGNRIYSQRGLQCGEAT